MQAQLGGSVERGDSGEFGRAFIEIADSCVLFDGLWAEGETHQVWMSHGDKVTELAPGFRIVASSPGAPYAVIDNGMPRCQRMMSWRRASQVERWESICFAARRQPLEGAHDLIGSATGDR